MLFSEYGINGVSIREIAKKAEISHSLIIRYFGSKNDIAAEVLRREIEKYTKIPDTKPAGDISDILISLREIILQQLSDPDTKITLQMIVRSEMDGMTPELTVPKNSERLINKLTELIRLNQTDTRLPDPGVAAAVIMGALTSLIVLSPWFYSAIDLSPEEVNKHNEETADILVDIFVRSAGLPGDIVRRKQAGQKTE